MQIRFEYGESQMRIDPLDTLVFGMRAKKGAYALLLGSGVSRSASIPTGWEIVKNLIEQLACLQQKSTNGDPEQWFVDEYKSEPNYSDLLEHLGKTPSERQRLLKEYFEPTEDEQEKSIKVPQKAHKAIANLVKKGHIKVIITTNFDRLIEKSLDEEGIRPVVISSSDYVKGMEPLHMIDCAVIKINGDYLDTNIKNTAGELDEYDEETNKLIGRILDEYGLIVCGWSADWDKGLSKAIEMCQSRRYTTYWTLTGDPTENAKKLIAARKAETIKIEDADSFFTKIEDKLSSIESFNRSHPISSLIAVESLKKYIVDDKSAIKLHDMVKEETERAYKLIDEMSGKVANSDPDSYRDSMKQHEAAIDMLLPLMIHGCFWGKFQHDYLWMETLERLANYQIPQNGIILRNGIRQYPALLLLYGMGITSIATGRYDFLTSLFSVKAYDRHLEKKLVIDVLKSGNVLNEGLLKKCIPSLNRIKLPASEYLHDLLREYFQTLIPDDEKYTRLFDRFEYLKGLINCDIENGVTETVRGYGPFGRFVFRAMKGHRSSQYREDSVPGEIDTEVARMDHNWPLIQAGFFQKSVVRFKEVKKAYDEQWLKDEYLHWP